MELDVASIFEAIAKRDPQRDCLIFRDRHMSWQDVSERTTRLGSFLRSAGLGRQPTSDSGSAVPGPHSDITGGSLGDRVALYLLNGNEYLEGMLGAWKAGCVPFNVNYRYVAAELRYLLEDSGARAVIVHDRFLPVLSQVLSEMAAPPGLILAVADGSPRIALPGLVDYEEALAQADSALPTGMAASWSGDDIYLCYTGGTTGLPKGALWRQGDFLVSALGVRRKDGIEFESIEEAAGAATSSMRALPAPPLMHGAAHWNAISCWLAGGAVVIQDVVDHFDPENILDTIERHRVTSLLLVGDPMARPLLDQLSQERRIGKKRDLGSLRHVVSGGAVLSIESKNRLLEELGDVRIIDVLGSTESGRQAMSDSSRRARPAAGFESSETSVVLSEDMTRQLEAGDEEIGWLAQTGRVPLGYLNDPAKTSASFPTVDGIRYAVPGDRARLERDGSVKLLGRDSVCINTGGEKVFAEEVETALKVHPAVFDAVVCGSPSERFGEEVVAVVELRPGVEVSDDQLLRSVGQSLARFKLPRRIIRREQIVRSPSGKADYRWAKSQADPASGD